LVAVLSGAFRKEISNKKEALKSKENTSVGLGDSHYVSLFHSPLFLFLGHTVLYDILSDLVCIPMVSSLELLDF